jgi:hypothetical protein
MPIQPTIEPRGRRATAAPGEVAERLKALAC